MTSTYVNDLRLNEMATGDQSGSWGTVTNLNLELIGEALGYGTEATFNTDANKTTTVLDGGSDPARAMYFKVTSTVTDGLTATRQLTIAPDTINRLMFIENATTGGESITIKQGSGAGAAVTIPNGDTKAVILPGSGSGSIVLDAFASLSVVDLTVQDALTVSGGALLNGATPTLTIGDAGAEDAKIVFDGNAADYHVGLDDSEDALQIGLGSALGTTPRITIRAAEVVVNDLGIDLDFRVESDNLTHALFVQGSDGNVGIGQAPEAWTTYSPVLQIGNAAAIATYLTDDVNFTSNAYFNATSPSGWKFQSTDTATRYQSATGSHTWYNSASGSADAALTWVKQLEIDASGNIIIANTGGTLQTATGGTGNLRLGEDAGDAVTGNFNVLVGKDSGTALEGGAGNVGLGYRTLYTSVAGDYNTAIGREALLTSNVSGNNYNVAVGAFAGKIVSNSVNNTMIGANSGILTTTGHSNTFIGQDAGGSNVSGDSNIVIGNGIDAASPTADSQLNIGGWIQGLAGDIGIGTTTINARLDIDGAGGSPATSGTTQNGVVRIRNADNNNCLDIGVISGSPYGSWIQATDVTSLGEKNGLYLNPNGGSVGIGIAAPARQLVLYGSAPYMAFQNSTTGAAAGDGFQVQMAGVTAYLVNYEAGTVVIGSGGADRLTVETNGDATIENGNLVIGTDGKGIDFSAQTPASGITPSAELLDHYEEGAWTPTFVNGGSASLASGTAKYVRIGSCVTVTFYWTSISPTADTAAFQIGGIPFTPAANAYYGGSMAYSGQNDLQTMLPIAGAGNAYIYFENQAASTTAFTNNAVRALGLTGDAADSLIVSMTYFV